MVTTLLLLLHNMLVHWPQDLCDYCFIEHEKLHGNHETFNNSSKWCKWYCASCNTSMCQDCIDSSKIYVNDPDVQKYSINLCGTCVISKWADPEYKSFVLHAIAVHEQYMRKSLKKTILSWLLPSSWTSHSWPNNTSISLWKQKKTALKILSKDTQQDFVNSSNSLMTSP